MIKFGSTSPFGSSDIRKNIADKLIKEFGIENYSQMHYNLDNLKLLSKEYIELNFIEDGGFLMVKEFCSFLNCGHAIPYIMCKEFGVTYIYRSGSLVEKYLVNFLSSLLDIRIIENSRKIIKPNELDIYLPEYKLAIEYNGIMWHSCGTSPWSALDNPVPNQNRHLDKTKACQEKEIDLIHIFEDEYLNDQDTIELLLKRKLGLEFWPIYTQDIVHWNLNHGNLPEQLQKDYKVIKTIPPRANYFKSGTFKISQWTSHKTEEELYSAGYRKYYDCGSLTLAQTQQTKKDTL